MKLVIRSMVPLLNARRSIDGPWPIVGTIELQGDQVSATGSGVAFVTLPVLEPGTGKRLGSRDGETWLRALALEFRSGYDTAEIIE